jgi:transposase, IS5 family
MRPRERRETGEQDLFRSRLDQIIDMKHPLVTLGRTVDWGFLETRFGEVYTDNPGQPPLPTRLMAGLAILKHTYDLSDDTTVQPKNVTFPTDAKLLNRAREKLVRLAKRHGVDLRQSYARVGKFALIQHQRYAHAKQFKRANRMLKKLRTYLGRVIRDIGRKTEDNGGLETAFAKLLLLARRVREQKQHQRGPKVYSLHAPEVECIGKGKAHRPYEFGVKVSVATTLKHCKGGQFVTHVKALPGNPYDGHTLATVIPDMEAMVGNTIARILADKGYRGHNAPPDYKFRVFISGQKRGVTPKIKRELRRRSAVEPVIGHLKAEHRMGRNYLWFRHGDANNAVLAAAGYNFRRLIRWLRILLRQILTVLFPRLLINPA